MDSSPRSGKPCAAEIANPDAHTASNPTRSATSAERTSCAPDAHAISSEASSSRRQTRAE